MKAYGTGLLSSAGELEEMRDAELRPLDLEAATNQDYDPVHVGASVHDHVLMDQNDGAR